MANRPSAAEVAKLDSHLTHIIVTGETADGLNVFVDGQLVLHGSIESLTVDIVAPGDTEPEGRIAAVLSRYETTADGQKRQSGLNLFPGTIELVAKGKRLSLTCTENGFDDLYLGLGLRADGTSDGLTGVQSLKVALLPGGTATARLVWTDGLEETIF